MKSDKEKQTLVQQLRKTPVIEVACKKAGISRATYYRWRGDDKNFLRDTNEALSEGRAMVNDMAESQLISGIREKHFSSIAYWLKHNSDRYGNKLEITHMTKDDERLTPEQEKVVRQALALSKLSQPKVKQHEQTKHIKSNQKAN